MMRRLKTKFPTVKLPSYLPKCQIWKQLSPKIGVSIPRKKATLHENMFNLHA